MNFLITGGAGFIASHLTQKLLQQNHKIIAVDNFHEFYHEDIKIKNILETTGKLDKLEEILKVKDKNLKIKKLVEIVKSDNYSLNYCDIRDLDALDLIFKKDKIDFVINIAALAGVRPSLENPISYEEVNIKGYLNLLELCKKYDIKKFIQASSSSVYGNNSKVPFTETDIVDFAISPYAATKKSGEVLGHVYHKLYNIDMFQLRFFTVYGPRQRPDLAIHKFTKMILEGIPIPFYGDGNTYRDYTFIDDIIDGILKTIQYLKNNENVYEIINLGESEAISLNEMVKTIEETLGKKAILNILPMQPGDVDKTYADISKAKTLIGYSPKTKFKDGIRIFVEWLKKGENVEY
ncbi:GDP-mannose 4,6-dehydratase [Cetobacterium sp. 2A]|uniref:GDP-mannose 4,6-dehydratase n=1 Tax=Cetobacterium sp. 2A TaxID=2754723 RepID=UPI00163CD8B1|nr:GDP-mannose 4,6-dehydratase [Cetobacterium sp. 2A]MBC2856863.1 GDP-mannose 4,6-dehydratase [Cetobacterium sp. 2A]